MKVNPSQNAVKDLEIFQLTEDCDGRAHPLLCDGETPPAPGFYFYAHDAEPFASSPEGHGSARYGVGPFATVADAEDY